MLAALSQYSYALVSHQTDEANKIVAAQGDPLSYSNYVEATIELLPGFEVRAILC